MAPDEKGAAALAKLVHDAEIWVAMAEDDETRMEYERLLQQLKEDLARRERVGDRTDGR
jgi:hypothetical protein